MRVFIIIYWVGLFIEIVIRAPFQKIWKASKKADWRVSSTEKALIGLLSVGMLLFPLFYSVTPWLDGANYRLPAWMGWFGVLLLACAVFLFAVAHRDLQSNWSPILEILEGQTLVTTGIYGYIRHPMYASQWVWSLAQILLLQNWLAGPIDLILFIPFYLLRVHAEEKMLLETFGEQYREYMKKTGAVIPKF